MMLILPKGAFIVERRELENKSLLFGVEEKKLNIGTIIFASPEVKQYEGYEVVFREVFSEEIELNGNTFLYFRDFDSGIYYAREQKD